MKQTFPRLWLADQAFFSLLLMLLVTAGAVLFGAPKAVALVAVLLSAACGAVMWMEWRNAA